MYSSYILVDPFYTLINHETIYVNRHDVLHSGTLHISWLIYFYTRSEEKIFSIHETTYVNIHDVLHSNTLHISWLIYFYNISDQKALFNHETIYVNIHGVLYICTLLMLIFKKIRPTNSDKS